MTTFHRWCLVAALALVVVGLPVVARSLPVGEQDVTAADLLARIDESSSRGYSGYVESLGSLDLPVADRFTDVAALFGERTRLRVWWRSADAWRVDKLLATGETDLVHDAGGTVEWSYERDRAEFGLDPAVRLPRTADLLPPAVAERLLRDVADDEVSRLPDRRVAGRVALGLRLVPGAPQSSVDRVDVWADRETGIPLLVEVYGAAAEPAFRSEFRDFSAERPAASDVAFAPPTGRGRRLRRGARHRRRSEPVRAGRPARRPWPGCARSGDSDRRGRHLRRRASRGCSRSRCAARTPSRCASSSPRRSATGRWTRDGWSRSGRSASWSPASARTTAGW